MLLKVEGKKNGFNLPLASVVENWTWNFYIVKKTTKKPKPELTELRTRLSVGAQA